VDLPRAVTVRKIRKPKPAYSGPLKRSCSSYWQTPKHVNQAVGFAEPLPGACPGAAAIAGTNYTHSPQKSLNLALLIDQHLYPAQMTFFARSALLWPSLRGKSTIPQGQYWRFLNGSHTSLVNGAAIPALVHCLIQIPLPRCRRTEQRNAALDSPARASGDGEKADNRRPARLGIVSDRAPDLDQTASGRAYVLVSLILHDVLDAAIVDAKIDGPRMRRRSGAIGYGCRLNEGPRRGPRAGLDRNRNSRLGFSQGAWLYYLKAGAAWINANYQVTNGSTSDTPLSTRPGWTVSVGVEYMFPRGWSAQFEYDYLDFGNQNQVLPNVGSTAGFSTQVHEIKLGLNYHWSP
jgi:hypothetical protein